MIDILLIALFGFIRAIYTSLLNGLVMWSMFKVFSILPFGYSLSYLMCAAIAFVPCFIVACIRLYKQTR